MSSYSYLSMNGRVVKVANIRIHYGVLGFHFEGDLVIFESHALLFHNNTFAACPSLY